MTREPTDLSSVADALEALRQEVACLNDRVAVLEARTESATPAASAHVHTAAPAPAPAAEGLSEELVLVIGAAVAAFLGKKAPIRQIRLLGSAVWAQQGRVTIQASHERVLARPLSCQLSVISRQSARLIELITDN